MKKKILFVLPSYEIGGTTVSTRHLISVLDKNKYDVKVWALYEEGVLKWLYEDVKQLPSSFISMAFAIKGWRHASGRLHQYLAGLLRYLSKSTCIRGYLMRFAINRSLENEHFDTVVACEEGITTQIVEKIKTHNHIAWVRCDYKRYFEVALKGKFELIYEKYNHIVCVSEQTRNSFISVYPSLINRTICIYNPQDCKMISKQAKIDDCDERFQSNERNVIVSLGRLSSVKRFNEIPIIANQLRKKGLSFTWYIIGEGEERVDIEKKIQQYNVAECVVLLGAKSNPYYYIEKATLYVCLSSSEACPRVINEAKILGTPVVSTDFPTIIEYLQNGVNGLVVPLEKMSQTIIEVLTNISLYEKIKQEISNFAFDNRPLIEKLEAIL